MAISEKAESIQLIGFNVGQRLFGSDIMSIHEILRDPEIETLDQGPDFIAGVVRVRGDVIPVIDLMRRLGGAQNPNQSGDAWVMIANTGGYTAGLRVDAVTRILKIDPDTVLPAPDLILEGLRTPYIRGVCESEEGMLVVLDLERLLSKDEINELKKMDIRR